MVGRIDVSQLPDETRDIIEMREDSESTFWRFCEYDYTDKFFQKIVERGSRSTQHSLILSVFGSQGSGKSTAAITLCKALDPDFDISKIYFGYDDLVYDRSNLKEHSAVLMDEQSQSYGVDSYRVNLLLTSLKEQLRKRSIHFVFCAPVLYSESKSSMYLIETIFIDYQTKECYCALMTRDEKVLGHVRIPHPLKIPLVTQEFLDQYEEKKDHHLDVLLGNGGADTLSDRAEMILKHEFFIKANERYVETRGYIPQNILVQVINKIYPEFHGGVAAYEIAAKIKMEKEISGEWIIPGKRKDDEKTPKKKTKKVKK